MRKTQWMELFRTIRQTWVLFLSICAIAAVGIMSFLAMQLSIEAELKTVSDYYRTQHLYDVSITTAQGFSASDLAALEAVPGISVVEGTYAVDGLLALPGEKRIVRAMTLTDSVNQSTHVDGRLPVTADECAIDISLFRNDDIRIGDTIAVDTRGQNGQSGLRNGLFTVTGVFVNPLFARLDSPGDRGLTDIGDGRVSDLLLVADAAMNKAAFSDRYPSAYLLLSGLDELDCFSAAYDAAVRDTIARLRALPDTASWVIESRHANAGYRVMRDGIASLQRMASIAAFIFLIVALMVCYFSMARIVEAQRGQIDTQRAFGFTMSEIRRRYIVYALCPITLGVAIGVTLGSTVLQRLAVRIWNANQYVFEGCRPVFSAPLAAAAVLVLYAAVLVATLLALRKYEAQPAFKTGYAPPPQGHRLLIERLFPVFRATSTLHKASIKSALADRSKTLTALVSIVGCVTLLVMGLQLKFSVDSALRKQYRQITCYDLRIITDLRQNANAVNEIASLLGQREDLTFDLREGLSFIRVQEQQMTLASEDLHCHAQLLCFAGDRPQGYLNLLSAQTGKPLDLQRNGIFINAKAAEQLHLRKGSPLTLVNASGEVRETVVADVFVHYTGNLFVVSTAEYRALFGQDPAFNALYVLAGEEAVLPRMSIATVQGFVRIESLQEDRVVLDDFKTAVNAFVALLCGLSAFFAMTVLLSLAEINVRQHEREMMILRVDGFSLRSVRRFVSCPAWLLTLPGIAIGIAVGSIASQRMLIALETTAFQLDRSIQPATVLISCGIMLLFTFAVNAISLRRARHMELTRISI